jgi:hypothetical protein
LPNAGLTGQSPHWNQETLGLISLLQQTDVNVCESSGKCNFRQRGYRTPTYFSNAKLVLSKPLPLAFGQIFEAVAAVKTEGDILKGIFSGQFSISHKNQLPNVFGMMQGPCFLQA